MAFRRSRVRSASAPPIKSSTYGDLRLDEKARKCSMYAVRRHNQSWTDGNRAEGELDGLDEANGLFRLPNPPCGPQCPACEIYASALAIIICYCVNCPMAESNQRAA